MRQVVQGVADFGRGCRFWARRPRLMLLGVLPALVVFVALVALLVALVGHAMAVATWLTPLPAFWSAELRALIRAAVAIALIVAGFALSVVLFTTLTLIVGQPVYDHVSRAVEQSEGGIDGEVQRGLGAQLGAGLVSAIRSLVVAAGFGLVVAVAGLVPTVGPVLAVVVAVLVGGRNLAIELTAPPCDARGVTLGERRLLLRAHRWRALGFGACCYVAFLVPGGAVLFMPAAVAGGTLLARSVLAAGPAQASGVQRGSTLRSNQ